MYKQIELPYSFDALEPYIDKITMETHYTKHHAAYTKNLNSITEKAGLINVDIVTLLSSLNGIPDEAVMVGIRNNGGGFYNHNLYFGAIGPNGGGEPGGMLAGAINQSFGSFGVFAEKISVLATGQFGSGWAWLSVKMDTSLALSASANQDNPLMENRGLIPILAIDVWEHAYYLKYRNLRADYVKAFFNVINWKAVEDNYKNAIS